MLDASSEGQKTGRFSAGPFLFGSSPFIGQADTNWSDPTLGASSSAFGGTLGGKKFAAARQVGRAAAIAKERVWNKLSLSVTIERLTEKL